MARIVGARKPPHRYPNEELWRVVGHDGRGVFATGVIVSNGVVVSVPTLVAWMDKRPWLEVATICEGKGWIIEHVDPEAVMREKARVGRDVVQMGLDLDG